MEYQHGGDIYGNQVCLDYSVNLNPFGMPQGVREAIKAAADHCAVYPDSQARQLRESLSKEHAVPKDGILCGNGAADLIFLAVFARKPKKAVILAPTFSEYEQALTGVGCEISYFYLKEEEDFSLDPEKFAASLDGFVDMVFLCNPNNPTGKVVFNEGMRKILDRCKTLGIFLIVDECFLDFAKEEEAASLIPLTTDYDNLAVLKAFTKMYGMAGVRLGYLISGSRTLLEDMEGLRQPWSVSTLAQAAGIAALREQAQPELVRALLERERPFVKTKLEELGFHVWDSQVNYLLFSDSHTEADGDLYHRCLQKGLLIRWCGNYRGLKGRFYRICIRERESNLAMFRILTQVLEERRK